MTGPFNTPYWPEDYFNQFFRSSGGGAIVGSLRGSAAGVATVTGDLTTVSAGHSGVVRLAGSLSFERIEEMLAWVRKVSVGLNAPAATEAEAQRAAHLKAEVEKTEAALLAALARAESRRVVARAQANDDEEALVLLLAA